MFVLWDGEGGASSRCTASAGVLSSNHLQYNTIRICTNYRNRLYHGVFMRIPVLCLITVGSGFGHGRMEIGIGR